MRAPGAWSVAVRKPDDTIVAQRHVLGRLADRNRAARIPFVRGIVVLWESLSLGFRALSWSAEQAAGEEEEPLSKTQIGWTMALAFALFAGIFIVLPAFAAGALVGRIRILFNVSEGAIRLALVHRLHLGDRQVERDRPCVRVPRRGAHVDPRLRGGRAAECRCRSSLSARTSSMRHEFPAHRRAWLDHPLLLLRPSWLGLPRVLPPARHPDHRRLRL